MSKLEIEEKRKRAIIISTLKIIAYDGFDVLTIDAIAESAKCSHGIINYYFKTKENLVVESFRYFLEYYNSKIKDDITPDMNEVEILKVILKHALPLKNEKIKKEKDEFVLTYELKTNLFIQFFSRAQFNLPLEEVFREVYMRQFEDITGVIRSGIKNGAFKNVSSEIVSYTILTLILGLANFRTLDFLPAGVPDAREVCNEYIKNIITKSK